MEAVVTVSSDRLCPWTGLCEHAQSTTLAIHDYGCYLPEQND